MMKFAVDNCETMRMKLDGTAIHFHCRGGLYQFENTTQVSFSTLLSNPHHSSELRFSLSNYTLAGQIN
jgi:hypothetical protein